jgi:hypothetical protein
VSILDKISCQDKRSWGTVRTLQISLMLDRARCRPLVFLPSETSAPLGASCFIEISVPAGRDAPSSSVCLPLD